MIEEKAASNPYIDSSHLGDQGELWFAAALPRGWVWQPPRRDLGKDGLIVIRDGSKLHNLEFSVQIKTSARPKVQKECIVLSGVSRSSIIYWFASPLPTLVVAVDITNRTGCFAWHYDLFNSPTKLFQVTYKTLTIRIPQTNRLDKAGWKSIREDVMQYYNALLRVFSVDAIAPHLFGTVNSIARIVGNLIRLPAMPSHMSIPTEKEGISILIEQIDLRDMMAVVRSLLQRFAVGSNAYNHIAFWLKSVEATAFVAYPSLRTFPVGHQIPADFELMVAPELVAEARQKLVLAAVDLIKLLTSSQPPDDAPSR